MTGLDADRRPPPLERIAEHWAGRCAPGTDTALHLVDAGEPCCFACGWYDERGVETGRGLERAHVVPHAFMATSDPAGYALLCKRCHRDAPDTSDPAPFWHWVATCPHNRNPWNVRAERALELAARLDPDEIDAFNAMPRDRFRELFGDAVRETHATFHSGHFSVGTLVELHRAVLRLDRGGQGALF